MNTHQADELAVLFMRFRSISLPLCGAAVTFFAAAKKVTKESSRSARSMLGVTTRDTRGMEQPLSVRLCEVRSLARPWLPPRMVAVSGAAAFRSGLALRARTKGCSGHVRAGSQSNFDERWHFHAGRLRCAAPSVMPNVGHAVQDG